SASTTGAFGYTMPLLRELQRIDEAVDAGGLRVDGDIQRLSFPRTLADRLFGKRDQDALVVPLSNGRDDRFRLLLLRDGGDVRVVAAEGPGGGAVVSSVEGL